MAGNNQAMTCCILFVEKLYYRRENAVKACLMRTHCLTGYLPLFSSSCSFPPILY